MLSADETWRGVEKLVCSEVMRWWRLYGGDIHVWQSEAHLAFIYALRSFDEEKGLFNSWLVKKIRWGFMYAMRRERARRVRRREVGDSELWDIGMKEEFSLERLLDEVSDDARGLVIACLGSEREVRRLLLGVGSGGMEVIRDRRVFIDLFVQAGWDEVRVARGMKEVQEALGL